MWLTGYIAKKTEPMSRCGQIVRGDDKKVSVFSSLEQRDIKVALPYGYYSVPTVGQNSIIIPTESGNVVVGVCDNSDYGLAEGEIMLCSKGGARLYLNNKGQVLVNGKVIS